jgi:hypothetical protein
MVLADYARQVQNAKASGKARTRKRVLISTLYVVGLVSFYIAAGPYAVAGALLVLLAGVI